MNYQPNDLNSVKILICYLLYNLEAEIDSEALYDIAVESGTINYFYYNEAIDELIINDTIFSNADDAGHLFFSLSKKGIEFVKDFSSYVQRSFRDRLMYSAMQYKAKLLQNASLSLEYDNTENGCNLICKISDKDKLLIDLKLFTQSQTQAELIGERISSDPSKFYSNFMDFILSKKPLNDDDEKS